MSIQRSRYPETTYSKTNETMRRYFEKPEDELSSPRRNSASLHLLRSHQSL